MLIKSYMLYLGKKRGEDLVLTKIEKKALISKTTSNHRLLKELSGKFELNSSLGVE